MLRDDHLPISLIYRFRTFYAPDGLATPLVGGMKDHLTMVEQSTSTSQTSGLQLTMSYSQGPRNVYLPAYLLGRPDFSYELTQSADGMIYYRIEICQFSNSSAL